MRSLIDDMSGWAHRPQLCIVGEPTLLRTALGHKGKSALMATCPGAPRIRPTRPAVSMPFTLACELIDKIRDRQPGIEADGVR